MTDTTARKEARKRWGDDAFTKKHVFVAMHHSSWVFQVGVIEEDGAVVVYGEGPSWEDAFASSEVVEAAQ